MSSNYVPKVRGSILRNIVTPRCPNRLCHRSCLAVVSLDTSFAKFWPLSRGPSSQAAIQTSSSFVKDMGLFVIGYFVSRMSSGKEALP